MGKDKLEVDCTSSDEETIACEIRENDKLIAELKVGVEDFEERVKFTVHDKAAVLKNMKEIEDMYCPSCKL